MDLLLSNFFKFLNLDIRGHKNSVQIYNKRMCSRIPSKNGSLNEESDSDVRGSSTTSYRNDESIDFNLKSLNTRESNLTGSEEIAVESKAFDYSCVVDAIPQNLLVHMARLPYFFERLIYHSVGICIDSLLFEMTFMPIQAITTVSHFITKFVSYITREVKYLIQNELFKPIKNLFRSNNKNELGESGSVENKEKQREDKSFESVRSNKSFRDSPIKDSASITARVDQSQVTLTEICGCVRFLVLVATIYIFSYIDTSKVYHNIKGQPLMKLYVIFNMLEICERLCRSFSRDIMDSLLRTTIKIFLNHFPEENNSRKTGNMDTFEREECSERYRKSHRNVQTDNSGVTKDSNNEHRHRKDDVNTFSWSYGENKPSKVSGLYVLDGKADCESSSSRIVNDNLPKNKSEMGTNRKKYKSKGDSKEGDCGFLTAKSPCFIPLETFVGNNHMESILNSCRKYSDSFNIYYKFVFLYLFSVATIAFHAFLHLVRVLSLNIAINSPESTMFLLLITNNFSEIKSTVFKRYNTVSLFVIFASDAVERCYLFCDGLLVILKMSTSKRHLRSYVTVLSWLVVIYGLEMLIDLLKHGYLIKFNKIRSETFEKYNSTLVIDTLLSRSVYNLERLTLSRFEVPCKGSFSFSHISSRRLGFISSPIVTLIVCSLPKLGVYLSIKTFTISVLIWLSLVLMKVSLSILLTAYSIEKRDEIYVLDPSFYEIGAL